MNDQVQMGDLQPYQSTKQLRDYRPIATAAINGWPQGRIEVWAAFQTVLGTDAQQPAEVISRFGELGEKIQGNNVTKAGSMKRVEVTETLVLR